MEIKTIISYSAISIIVLGILYLVWHFSSITNKLREKIIKMNLIVDEESLELLKGDFIDIYHLYLKLSEKKKRNFYARVTELREKIEEQIKAKKKIQELFEKVDDGNLDKRKKMYLEIHRNYRVLPEKSREKYYARIVRLKYRLERGD